MPSWLLLCGTRKTGHVRTSARFTLQHCTVRALYSRSRFLHLASRCIAVHQTHMQAASRDINNQPDSRLAFLIPTRPNPNISLVRATPNHFSNSDTRKKASHFTKQTNTPEKKKQNRINSCSNRIQNATRKSSIFY